MIKYTLFPLLLIILCSCDNEGKRVLRGNTGNQGEIIVVAPGAFWKSSQSNSLKKSFSTVFPGLPAPEPMFRFVEVNQEGFTELFKTHRNIIQIKLDESDETKVEYSRDVYARQQVVATITLRSYADLDAFIAGQMHEILWLFNKAEVDRLVSRNKDFGDDKLNKEVAGQTEINIVMQQDFMIAKSSEDVMWLRLDRQKPVGGFQHYILQGILIYSRPYTDTSQFSNGSLIDWKNLIDSATVEGPSSCYMSISTRLYQPEFYSLTFLNQGAKEIRGLWRMEGGKGVFMGGPFYALTFYNPRNHKQYMVEGYVYGPQFDKAPFIREIEAIAKSVSLAEEVE